MDRELTPAELEELLPAYALDALDDDERQAVDAHLASDPDARAEVASLQRAASFLAHTGGAPPTGVWEKLEAAIRANPGPSGEVPPPRLLPRAAAPAASRPSRRWQWVAAAAVIVASATFSLWAVDRGGSDPPVDVATAARAAATAPGARRADLRTADGTTLARAVVLPDGTGYVTTTGLPAAGADRTYQLWGVDDHATISLGVMGPAPKVVAFHTDRPPNALAITNERAGGVVSSAETPTAVGDLRA
jgi:anti-sigma factor RsiW